MLDHIQGRKRWYFQCNDLWEEIPSIIKTPFNKSAKNTEDRISSIKCTTAIICILNRMSGFYGLFLFNHPRNCFFLEASGNHFQSTHTVSRHTPASYNPHTHVNVVGTGGMSLVFSRSFNSRNHQSVWSLWTLRSAGVSGGNSALSLCGSYRSYLLPRLKGLANRMLCYATQITLNNEGFYPQLLGVLLQNGPLFSAFFRIFW